MDHLESWWGRHHRAGGTVWSVDYPVEKYKTDWLALQDQASTLDPKEWRAFSTASITNNKMPNRELLEDTSKIHWLRKEFETNGITHPVQLMYEPWRNKWRVHPGSGRCIAAASLDWPTIPAVYINFRWSTEPPWHCKKIDTVQEFVTITNSKEFDIYPVTADVAVERDAEWDRIGLDLYTNTNDAWQMCRWSEGHQFMSYKKAWREFGSAKYT